MSVLYNDVQHMNFFVKLRLSRRLESLVPAAIALKTL